VIGGHLVRSDSGAKPVVVIPVHKSVPTELERISLRQCGRCFTGRDLLLLAPNGLDIARYREVLPVTDAIRVERRWMESIEAYNRLMISSVFFDSLGGYSHLLIHEPDALVLRDELDYWCQQPHDYIGAPWFEGYALADHDAPVIGVGNFGLSLLRLDAIRDVLSSRKRWYPLKMIIKDLIGGASGDPTRFVRGVRGSGAAGRLSRAWRLYEGHCDIFWGRVVPQLVPTFRVAPVADAVRFAWEVLPERCYTMCNGVLPFGLHAWANYNYSFLAPLLSANGVDLMHYEH
jgi:Protein of unknown function (DUF5672)